MATNLAKQYDAETFEKLKKSEVNILCDLIRVCKKYDINYFIVWGTSIGVVRHKGFIPWDDDIDIGMFREDYDKLLKVVDSELGDNYILTTPETVKGYAGSVIKLQRKNTKFVPYISRTVKCDLCLHIDIFVYDKLDKDEKTAIKKVKKTRRLAQLIFLYGSPYPIIKMKGIVGWAAQCACFIMHYAMKIFGISSRKLYRKFEEISKSANDTDSEYYTSYQSLAAIGNKVKKEDIFPLKQMPFEDIMVNMPNKYDKVLRQTYGDYMKFPKVEDRVNHVAYIVDFGDESVLKRSQE